MENKENAKLPSFFPQTVKSVEYGRGFQLKNENKNSQTAIHIRTNEHFASRRKLRTDHRLALKHLEMLEEEDLVQHRTSGRTWFYRFANTVGANATAKLLEEWETNNA